MGRWFKGFVLLIILVGSITGGAACGQVITLTPTSTPAPTATIAIAIIAVTPPPTPTPAPYTPAPTPTPTITPTPVIYTLVSGDSLLSIANQYGVTVSSLQDANGILDPRTLQIGQQLIIPGSEDVDNTLSTTATPTPLAVSLHNLNFTETAIGGLWVLGEVVNDSAVPVEQVRVGVSLLDEAGSEMVQGAGLVAIDFVDVQGRAPFAVIFGELPGPFERYRTYPISAVEAYIGSYYRDLEIRDLQGEGERYSSHTVTGTVYNFGPEEAVSVQVVITAYDAVERVIAMRQVVPEHNVVPRGGETTFTAILSPIGGPVARLEAIAQGRRLGSEP
ncbi:MAG: LysM peptidoglycan-binding domain-containing protein [Chloroflexota bacterium]